jgi:2-phospho-L-lactate guanylyltransferase
MTCWVIIPIKPPEQAKSRLAEVLDAHERAALAGTMLRHVVNVAQAADHVQHLVLLGPSRLGMDEDIPLLADPGGGLNPALHSALAQVSREGAHRFIVLFADLPKLAMQDVQLLARVRGGTIAIAPDRHGTGTNALSLPLPEAKGFTFAFGPDSFALHRTEAARLGLKIETIHSQGLARDVDVPEDLPDAAGLIGY